MNEHLARLNTAPIKVPTQLINDARHRNNAIRLSGNAMAVVGIDVVIDIDVCYDGSTLGSIE
jgi:hypothetical protein